MSRQRQLQLRILKEMEAAGVDPQQPYSYVDGKFVQETVQKNYGHSKKEKEAEDVSVESDQDVKHEPSIAPNADDVQEDSKKEEVETSSKTKKPTKKSTKPKAKDE